MKKIFTPAVAAAMLLVTACGGQGDDALGDDAADAGEAQAENLQAMADNSSGATADRLEDQAEAAEERGAEREEQIDDSDVNADRLSQEQREALTNAQ